MKVLIVGLGSIGLRHLKNLIKLGVNEISIVRRNCTPFENYNIYSSIDDAFRYEDFTHAIIATPSAMHLNSFTEIIKHNVSKIYLEKPIATNLTDGEEIIFASKKHPDVSIYVGYDLRFDLGLLKVKKLLDSGILGDVLSFQSEVGQFLPDWRPHEDYRKGMSASKKLGGGVMLDLIHEFDYITWLMGPVKKIVGIHGKISTLEIETEDVSKVILQLQKGAIGTISLDYLQKDLVRNCKIVLDKGIIIWDYVTSKVSWKSNSEDCLNVFDYQSFERNDRFISTLNAFISDDLKETKMLATLNDGIISLSIVANAKKSFINNQIINL